MTNIKDVFNKIKRRLRAETVTVFKKKSYYHKIYTAYWHYRFSDGNKSGSYLNYYSAVPNSGAGIGHQMANWIAGYWYANQFGLQFAHIPFSCKKWESFLGFCTSEIKVADLLNNGYKKVRLPLFDEFNFQEVELQKKIIASYQYKKVVFVAEQDQGYQDQFGVMVDIKQKFHAAETRKKDNLIYDKQSFNIAIHVRRGDIVIGQENQNPNLLLRWQDNDYFEKVLHTVVDTIQTDKPIAIYLFSQGTVNDFPEFEQFSNINFCLDMNAQDSFLHMVFADLIITSKSSFSYKPALLSNGIKVCPQNFWHGYPNTKDWIMVDKEGSFDIDQLKKYKK